jgi:predicted O-methyltransferase YrrM
MMGDPTEAAFFSLLLKSINAKCVLEIGVFTGYTTIVMAQAVADTGGKVVAFDINNEYVSIGKPYWKKAGVLDGVQVILGPAVESLPKNDYTR